MTKTLDKLWTLDSFMDLALDNLQTRGADVQSQTLDKLWTLFAQLWTQLWTPHAPLYKGGRVRGGDQRVRA